MKVTEGPSIKAFGILRILIGIMFVVSSFMKLMQPYQNFLLTVHSYEILNGPLAEWFAKGMPWAEFMLGVLMILGLWLRLALLGLWAMNTMFIAALSSAMIRKLPLQECGCFGESFSLPLYQILILDIVVWLLFMVMAGFFARTHSWSLDKKLDA